MVVLLKIINNCLDGDNVSKNIYRWVKNVKRVWQETSTILNINPYNTEHTFLGLKSRVNVILNYIEKLSNIFFP